MLQFILMNAPFFFKPPCGYDIRLFSPQIGIHFKLGPALPMHIP